MQARSRQLLLVMTLVAVTPARSQASGPFSIEISTDTPEVKAGSNVFIKIDLTNTSNHDIDCSRVPTNGTDRAYQYQVRSDDGTEVPKVTRRHPEIGETFHAWPCVLKPGQSTGFDDNLISKLFDMSRPGRYSIRVSRFISGAHKEKGEISSNTLTITVGAIKGPLLL